MVRTTFTITKRLTVGAFLSATALGAQGTPAATIGADGPTPLAAAAHWVRSTMMTTMSTTVLVVDPRRWIGRTASKELHTPAELAGVADGRMTELASLDSIASCGGYDDSCKRGIPSAFLRLTPPKVLGDSAMVEGYLSARVGSGGRGGPGSVGNEFRLNMVRTGESWKVTATKGLGGS